MKSRAESARHHFLRRSRQRLRSRRADACPIFCSTSMSRCWEFATGCRLLAQKLGGRVEPSTRREYGHATIQIDRAESLFSNLRFSPRFWPFWMSHGDQITVLPDGFAVLAHSDTCPFAAMANPRAKSTRCNSIPKSRTRRKGSPSCAIFCTTCAVAQAIGRRPRSSRRRSSKFARGSATRACCARLSGGVDSSVAATLVGNAIGEQLVVRLCGSRLAARRRSARGRRVVSSNSAIGDCARWTRGRAFSKNCAA